MKYIALIENARTRIFDAQVRFNTLTEAARFAMNPDFVYVIICENNYHHKIAGYKHGHLDMFENEYFERLNEVSFY